MDRRPLDKFIIEEEQSGASKAKYGTRLIENLFIQLGQEFGKGFSVANLRNFRQFILTFPSEEEKRYALSSESSQIGKHINKTQKLALSLTCAETTKHYRTEAQRHKGIICHIEPLCVSVPLCELLYDGKVRSRAKKHVSLPMLTKPKILT